VKQDKIEAIEIARDLIKLNPVYLDTETTGLDDQAEVIDLAVVDNDGSKLIKTLIRPTGPIPSAASKIHGIIDDDVIYAPAFPEVLPNLRAFTGRLIVIYNRDYDLRVLSQSAKAHKAEPWAPLETVCAMELYAQYYGHWDDHRRSYRWQKQSNAARQLGLDIPDDLHRAAADADLCRRIVEAMASTPLPGEATQSSQLFIETFHSMSNYIHSWAKRKGFWEEGQGRNDGELIALIHSELSEALEAIRSGDPPSKIIGFTELEIELADCIIRIMDYASARDLDLAKAIVAKMAYNEDRPHKHGKEF